MKHIKKSMFISTVLMVVMLIAALSTATFAWYTSNNSVTSAVTKVGAAKSESANIGIGWYKGAPDSIITFDDLVAPAGNENAGNGNMYPVAPITFYNFENTPNGYTAPADAYATSPLSGLTTGIIANAFDTNGNEEGGEVDSLRIVNLQGTKDGNVYKNIDIKAAADYIHSTSGKATNIASFGSDYSILYTVTSYAYNNTVATTATSGKPVKDQYVSISNHQYTALTEISGECYTVAEVYEVVSTGGAQTLDAVDPSEMKISQLLAYQLVGSLASHTPNPGFYVVAYTEYKVAPFNAVSALDQIKSYDTAANSPAIGYIATTAGELNGGDIFVNRVTSSTDNGYGKATPKWNDNGFAYLYQIYEADNASDALIGNSVTITNDYAFNMASIDANAAFKAAGTVVKPGNYWSGNGTGTYEPANGPAIITMRDTTAETKTVNKFYVTNNGSDVTATVNNLRVSLTASGDNANLLRIAVFKNGKYYGTLGKTAPTTFGQILDGGKANDLPTYDALTSINLGTLATGEEAAFEIQLVVWFDGKELNDITAGKNCTFSLNFEAA